MVLLLVCSPVCWEKSMWSCMFCSRQCNTPSLTILRKYVVCFVGDSFFYKYGHLAKPCQLITLEHVQVLSCIRSTGLGCIFLHDRFWFHICLYRGSAINFNKGVERLIITHEPCQKTLKGTSNELIYQQSNAALTPSQDSYFAKVCLDCSMHHSLEL